MEAIFSRAIPSVISYDLENHLRLEESEKNKDPGYALAVKLGIPCSPPNGHKEFGMHTTYFQGIIKANGVAFLIPLERPKGIQAEIVKFNPSKDQGSIAVDQEVSFVVAVVWKKMGPSCSYQRDVVRIEHIGDSLIKNILQTACDSLKISDAGVTLDEPRYL